MRNHIHLIGVPGSGESLANTIRVAHGQYARIMNPITSGCGHLWQARFYSCPMADIHCWQALRYVENNPVRAGLVSDAVSYCYSSARAHAGLEYPQLFDFQHRLEYGEWRKRYKQQDWQRVLQVGVYDEAIERRIRESTMLGRPIRDCSSGSEVGVGIMESNNRRRQRGISISSSPTALSRDACFT